jgi:ferredoxin
MVARQGRTDHLLEPSTSPMYRLHSHRHRPVHQGVLPTERLRRDRLAAAVVAAQPEDPHAHGPHSLSESVPEYRRLMAPLLDGPVAATRAPIPDDLLTRQRHLKAAAYFLDATLAGVCRLRPDEAATAGTEGAAAAGPTHALVILIEFGLQDTCAQCLKCARECPCNAIPYGPKTLFNGYEIWKPDVEKCGKYRLTNMKGSACGRCMKTCPFNSEDLVEYEQRLWQAIEAAGSPQGAGGARPRPPEGEEEDLGAARRLLESRRRFIEQDDRMGGGERNPVKRWWWDLEIVGGVVQAPVAGVNERDLSPGREDRLAAAQKIAVFPPHLQPRGGTTLATVVPLERAAGLRASQEAQPPQVQDPAALKPSPDRR